MVCVFCDIIQGKQKADFVYQDQDFVAFRDINPKAPVHILLVPRKHIKSIQALKKEEVSLVASLILGAKEIARQQGIASGYKLVFNCGRKGGQIIDHLHLHLLGGWSGQGSRVFV